jgi:uncharacterized protein with PIN domain
LLRERRPRNAIEITSDRPLDQLCAIVNQLELEPPRELFTRCMVCNAALDVVHDASAADLLPPKARTLGGIIRRCPVCGRVYWPGSHVRRMTRALTTALPGWLK